MKNPLVDALRQAGERPAEKPTEESYSSTHAEHTLEIDDSPAGPAQDAPDRVDADGQDPLQAVESEPVFEHTDPVLTIDEPPDESSDESSLAPVRGHNYSDITAATGILTDRGAVLIEKLPLLVTVGRWSPAICVIVLTLSAGCYLVVANLAGTNLNSDFADRSGRTRNFAELQVDNDGLPVSAISVFATLDVRHMGNDFSLTSGSDAVNRVSTDRPSSANTAEHSVSAVTSSVTVVASRRSVIDDRTHEILLDAYAAYQDRNYVVAEKHYRQALAIEPSHHDALSGIAAVYVQTGRKIEAEIAYEKLLVVDPENTAAVAGVWSLRSADATRDAESEIKHLLQRYPQASHLHFTLGEFYAERGRWPDAKHEFLLAHQLSPRNADYSYNTAVSLDRLGDQDAAGHYYRLALETADKNSSIDRSAILAHLDDPAISETERL